jgi:hypothetical protein
MDNGFQSACVHRFFVGEETNNPTRWDEQVGNPVVAGKMSFSEYVRESLGQELSRSIQAISGQMNLEAFRSLSHLHTFLSRIRLSCSCPPNMALGDRGESTQHAVDMSFGICCQKSS